MERELIASLSKMDFLEVASFALRRFSGEGLREGCFFTPKGEGSQKPGEAKLMTKKDMLNEKHVLLIIKRYSFINRGGYIGEMQRHKKATEPAQLYLFNPYD